MFRISMTFFADCTQTYLKMSPINYFIKWLLIRQGPNIMSVDQKGIWIFFNFLQGALLLCIWALLLSNWTLFWAVLLSNWAVLFSNWSLFWWWRTTSGNQFSHQRFFCISYEISYRIGWTNFSQSVVNEQCLNVIELINHLYHK